MGAVEVAGESHGGTAEVAGGGGPPELSGYHESARRVTQEVLAGPEFESLDSGPTLLDRIGEVLEAVIGEIVVFLSNLPTWVWWVVVIWMIVTLVAIIGHLIWVLIQTVGSTGGGRSGSGTGRRTHPGSFFDVENLDEQSVRQRAEQLLRDGDWQAAARHLYVAALLWLDRTGRVRFHQSKTNGDYLRELVGRPDLSRAFVSLTQLFEPVAYGGGEADEVVCRQMHETLQGMRHEVATPASR